jgi:hypothetical protein
MVGVMTGTLTARKYNDNNSNSNIGLQVKMSDKLLYVL